MPTASSASYPWLTPQRKTALDFLARCATQRRHWDIIHQAISRLPGREPPKPESLRVMSYRIIQDRPRRYDERLVVDFAVIEANPSPDVVRTAADAFAAPSEPIDIQPALLALQVKGDEPVEWEAVQDWARRHGIYTNQPPSRVLQCVNRARRDHGLPTWRLSSVPVANGGRCHG